MKTLRLTNHEDHRLPSKGITVQCELTFSFPCSHYTVQPSKESCQPEPFACCVSCQMLGLPARSSFAKLQLWWVPQHWSKLKIGAVGSIGLLLCIYSVGEESKRGGNEAEFYADIVTSHRRISKGLEGKFDSRQKNPRIQMLIQKSLIYQYGKSRSGFQALPWNFWGFFSPAWKPSISAYFSLSTKFINKEGNE